MDHQAHEEGKPAIHKLQMLADVEKVGAHIGVGALHLYALHVWLSCLYTVGSTHASCLSCRATTVRSRNDLSLYHII